MSGANFDLVRSEVDQLSAFMRDLPVEQQLVFIEAVMQGNNGVLLALQTGEISTDEAVPMLGMMTSFAGLALSFARLALGYANTPIDPKIGEAIHQAVARMQAGRS